MNSHGEIMFNLTRMHSSRMRTARLMPVSPSMHCSGDVPGQGVYLVQGGVPGLGGVPAQGVVYLVLGGVPGLGVYLVQGGTWSGDVYLVGGGGVPGPGGVPGLGGVPDQVLPSLPPADRHTRVKT